MIETNQKKSHWASGINNYFSFIPLGLGAENKFWISLDWSIKRMSNFLSFSKTPSVACNLQIKKKKKKVASESLRLHDITPGVKPDLGIWPVNRKVNCELTKDRYLFCRAGEFLSSYPGLWGSLPQSQVCHTSQRVHFRWPRGQKHFFKRRNAWSQL